MTNENWKKKVEEIESNIIKEFGNSFLSFQRLSRTSKTIIHIYEHIQKKYMIKIIFVNTENENTIADISCLEKITNYSTVNHPGKIIKNCNINIEQEDLVLKTFRGYAREIELKGIFQ